MRIFTMIGQVFLSNRRRKRDRYFGQRHVLRSYITHACREEADPPTPGEVWVNRTRPNM
jgi:hypothetical protein